MTWIFEVMWVMWVDEDVIYCCCFVAVFFWVVKVKANPKIEPKVVGPQLPVHLCFHNPMMHCSFSSRLPFLKTIL